MSGRLHDVRLMIASYCHVHGSLPGRRGSPVSLLLFLGACEPSAEEFIDRYCEGSCSLAIECTDDWAGEEDPMGRCMDNCLDLREEYENCNGCQFNRKYVDGCYEAMETAECEHYDWVVGNACLGIVWCRNCNL